MKASDKAFISICTQGRHGSTLCKEGKFIKSNAFKINVKDTTGAGDNFAAGFLHGYINNYSLSKCSELGNYCAAETVKVIGARPDSNIKELMHSLREKEFTNVRKWIVQNLDNDPVRIFRRIYDNLYDYIDGSTIPHAVVIIADYQYKSAFVSDQEINLLACMTEIMGQVKFK